MRLVIRSLATAAVMSAAAVLTVSAQAAHPNFAGSWVMDVSKSQIGGNAPNAATWTIAQHGDTLVSDRVTTFEGMGDVKSHMVVGIDGKSWKNTITQPGIGDVEVTVMAAWDKSTLVVTTTGTMQETDFVQTVRWTLAADGKSLELRSSVMVGGEEVQSATTVWDRKN